MNLSDINRTQILKLVEEINAQNDTTHEKINKINKKIHDINVKLDKVEHIIIKRRVNRLNK